MYVQRNPGGRDSKGQQGGAAAGEATPTRGRNQACAAQSDGRKTGTRLCFSRTAEHSRTEARQSRVTACTARRR